MSVLKVIQERGSVRKYEDRPIPRDVLEQVLEAARLAQSAGNRQPWEFIVVQGKDMKKKLASVSESFVAEATATFVSYSCSIFNERSIFRVRQVLLS